MASSEETNSWKAVANKLFPSLFYHEKNPNKQTQQAGLYDEKESLVKVHNLFFQHHSGVVDWKLSWARV